MTIATAIAMNRFGLGARPDETTPDNPQKWLLDQLQLFDPRAGEISNQPDRTSLARDFQQYRAEARIVRQAQKSKATMDEQTVLNDEKRKDTRRNLRKYYEQAAHARLFTAIESNTGFPERLVHFWSNHLAISVEKLPVRVLAGNYEFDAIRPNIMGKFSDLLIAAVKHPAMLLFLDQAQSFGPNSFVAQRRAKRGNRKVGLNENLAREILELHTLGVRSGYSQNDVTEFARALTGWTIAGLSNRSLQRRMLGNVTAGETIFINALYEPGRRQIMGRRYDGPARKQATAILRDLSIHPAAAKHIATKLARHFVSDTPPETLVRKLEDIFLQTGGDLPSLYRVLAEAPECWPKQWKLTETKFKSPWEWVVSSLRATGIRDLPGNGRVAPLFRKLGQPVWSPGSPAGYADTAETWAGSAALMRRLELSTRMARVAASGSDARVIASQILPGLLSNSTADGIARAESPQQGLSLMLVSPEFLRR